MEWLDNLFGTAQSAATSVVNTISDIPAEWSAKVAELKARAQEFAALFADLQGKAAQAARLGLSSEYNDLMNRGALIRNSVQSVTSAIDSIYNSVSNLFGLSGIQRDHLGNLGVIPLIPIAVIVGAIALIVKWLSDAYQLKSKIDAGVSSGASPQQMTQILTGGGGLLSGGSVWGNAGLFLLIGAGVLVLVPLLKRAFKR